MKTAKLGAIFLVSVMALAGAGAAYAWWQDELTVVGNITMGTFGWEWSPVQYYFSHDYKNIITGDVWLEDTHLPDDPGYGHYDQLNILANNVYPCTDISIWTDIHFWGSVPGHIYDYAYEIELDGEPIDLPPWMFVEIIIFDGSPDILDDMGVDPIQKMGICEFLERLVCTQWHECYFLNFMVYIHWIQDDMIFTDPLGEQFGPFDASFDVPMNAELDFSITICGAQYNDPMFD